MRTAGLTMNDVWADRVMRERGVETHRFDGLEAEIGVLVESVELKHRGKSENFRPYLHLTGELRSVTPHDGLPYGIHQVIYSPGQGEKVDAYYEFDDQQMVAMAQRGYFNSAFVVPEEQLTGVEWELPAKVDALVLAPSQGQADPPVIFVRVHDVANLELTLETSEYDLTDYFADFSRSGVVHDEKAVDERSLRARSDAINSLFTDEDYELVEQVERREAEASANGVVDDMAAEVKAIEAQIEAEREQFVNEREHAEGTTEKLYRDRVARAMEEQEAAPAPVLAKWAVGGDLDFAADARPEPTMAEREAQAARRAADLDFGDGDGHGLGH